MTRKQDTEQAGADYLTTPEPPAAPSTTEAAACILDLVWNLFGLWDDDRSLWRERRRRSLWDVDRNVLDRVVSGEGGTG